MGVMGSLSQQLIDNYDGRGLQRSPSLSWKQDATLLHWPPGGGEARGNMSGLSSWHPQLTRAGGGSRFIGTRAAQLVVGVERERERITPALSQDQDLKNALLIWSIVF